MEAINFLRNLGLNDDQIFTEFGIQISGGRIKVIDVVGLRPDFRVAIEGGKVLIPF